MFARTPRLLLRPGFPEDAPALAAAMSDGAIARNLAVVPWPYTLRDAEAFLASPRDPVWEYVLSTWQAEECIDLMDSRVAAIGHSHVALWFRRDDDGQVFQMIDLAQRSGPYEIPLPHGLTANPLTTARMAAAQAAARRAVEASSGRPGSGGCRFWWR